RSARPSWGAAPATPSRSSSTSAPRSTRSKRSPELTSPLMADEQSTEAGSAEQRTGRAGQTEVHSSEQRDQRLRNLQALIARGIEPYHFSIEASHSAAELQESHGGLAAGEAVEGSHVSLAGRLVLFRMLGKLTFATLQDASGRIQVSFQKDDLE